MRGGDGALPEHLARDWRTAPVGDKVKMALAFAEKLTRSPDAMREADVTRLRDAGYSDTEISGIVLVTAHFNYMNRIGLAFGIEPPSSPDSQG